MKEYKLFAMMNTRTKTLDVELNTACEALLDKTVHTPNKQWEDNGEVEDVSKDDCHLLRLAALLHVLCDQLSKKLHGTFAFVASSTIVNTPPQCKLLT